MPGDWRVETFENAPLQIIDGDRGTNYPNQTEFSAAGHCLFLNAGNVTTTGFRFSDCVFITSEKDALLRKGKLVRNDVVLTTRGTVGNAAYFDHSVPFDSIRINSGMVIIRAQTPALHPRYLYLFVRSGLFHAQVSALRTGSAQPQLPIQDINRIEIPIPPSDEQKAIAYILGTLDDKIELNRKTNETLESIAKALFKSWFVDFDPVRAKAEGRPSGLPAEISDLFPDSFVESEVGEIPKGWSETTLASLVVRITARVGVEKAVVMSAVSSGELVRSDDYFKKRVYSKSIENYFQMDKSDFAYNPSRINIGSIGMLGDSCRGAVSPIYVVFRPKSGWQWFLRRTLNLNRVREEIKTLCSGSVRQSLSFDDFSSIPLVTPPNDSLVFAFNEMWDSISQKIQQLSVEKSLLQQIGDTLLPKLISGELRVPDAEALVAEAGL